MLLTTLFPNALLLLLYGFFFALFTHLITLDTKHTGLILFLSQSIFSALQKVTPSMVKKGTNWIKLVPEMLRKKSTVKLEMSKQRCKQQANENINCVHAHSMADIGGS